MDSIPRGALLVPTDLSSTSLPAAIYAATLAPRIGAPVVLLHVVSPRQIEEGIAEGRYVDNELEDVRSSTLWWFASLVPPEIRQGLSVTAVAAVGHPEHEILTTAHAIEARMIVMATHGRTGLPRAVLGSVAESVLRHAPCPVLTIPPAARPDTAPSGAAPAREGQAAMTAGSK